MNSNLNADAKAAIKRYRALVAQQRRLPLGEKWQLGSALKEAKARAYVEIEYSRTGIR